MKEKSLYIYYLDLETSFGISTISTTFIGSKEIKIIEHIDECPLYNKFVRYLKNYYTLDCLGCLEKVDKNFIHGKISEFLSQHKDEIDNNFIRIYVYFTKFNLTPLAQALLVYPNKFNEKYLSENTYFYTKSKPCFECGDVQKYYPSGRKHFDLRPFFNYIYINKHSISNSFYQEEIEEHSKVKSFVDKWNSILNTKNLKELILCQICSAEYKKEEDVCETIIWRSRKGNCIDFFYALEELKTMPYKKYLKTHHWLITRDLALERAEYKCQLCASKESLNVHHNTYENRGCEKDEDLVVLCENCHAKFHDKII